MVWTLSFGKVFSRCVNIEFWKYSFPGVRTLSLEKLFSWCANIGFKKHISWCVNIDIWKTAFPVCVNIENFKKKNSWDIEIFMIWILSCTSEGWLRVIFEIRKNKGGVNLRGGGKLNDTRWSPNFLFIFSGVMRPFNCFLGLLRNYWCTADKT